MTELYKARGTIAVPVSVNSLDVLEQMRNRQWTDGASALIARLRGLHSR